MPGQVRALSAPLPSSLNPRPSFVPAWILQTWQDATTTSSGSFFSPRRRRCRRSMYSSSAQTAREHARKIAQYGTPFSPESMPRWERAKRKRRRKRRKRRKGAQKKNTPSHGLLFDRPTRAVEGRNGPLGGMRTDAERPPSPASRMGPGARGKSHERSRAGAARGRGRENLLAPVAIVVLLSWQPSATLARQCTLSPARPASQGALPNSSNASSTPAPSNTSLSNSTVNVSASSAHPPPSGERGAASDGLPAPPLQDQAPSVTSQLAPDAREGIQATPISSKLDDQAAEITADLDAMNQTIQRVANQDFFPDVKISKDIESFIAVCLILIGVFSCFLGAQYAKQVFVVLAFLAGVVVSMYPIDALAGDILCGPYLCSPDTNPSEFCGWAVS